MELFKPTSTNKASRILFYVFEGFAAAYFLVMFIMAIVDAANWDSAAIFFTEFFDACWKALVLFGIGKLIDFLTAAFVKKNNKDSE